MRGAKIINDKVTLSAGVPAHNELIFLLCRGAKFDFSPLKIFIERISSASPAVSRGPFGIHNFLPLSAGGGSK